MEPPTTGNLTDDVVANAREHGAEEVFSRPGADGWEGVTAAAFHDEVRAVAKGLVAAGIEAGDRVALISKTRYEWTLLDYAIWFAGAVTVPVYETSSAEQVQWILAGLRRPRRRRRDARARRPGHRGPWRPHRAQPRLVDHRQRASTSSPGSARTSPTTSSSDGVRRPGRATWPR